MVPKKEKEMMKNQVILMIGKRRNIILKNKDHKKIIMGIKESLNIMDIDLMTIIDIEMEDDRHD